MHMHAGFRNKQALVKQDDSTAIPKVSGSTSLLKMTPEEPARAPDATIARSKPMSFDRIVVASFLAMGHVFALLALYELTKMPLIRAAKWLGFTIFMYLVTGTLGITAGAHRLWAHRSYKANFGVRLLMGFMNCVSNQNSILSWVTEHRTHHKYVDSDADPHNIREGFWHAHMLWLFRRRPDAYAVGSKTIDLSDLLADPIVRYQHKVYPILGPICCYVIPAYVGKYFTGELWLSFLFFGCLRWIMALHATWTVNSVAHMFGERPYRPNMLPAEIALVSMLSGGEYDTPPCWTMCYPL